jgi:hypothetical protein
MPIRIGMPTKKTIVVPCIVNSWLKKSGLRTSLRGQRSCRRMRTASTPPTTRKTTAIRT